MKKKQIKLRQHLLVVVVLLIVNYWMNISAATERGIQKLSISGFIFSSHETATKFIYVFFDLIFYLVDLVSYTDVVENCQKICKKITLEIFS